MHKPEAISTWMRTEARVERYTDCMDFAMNEIEGKWFFTQHHTLSEEPLLIQMIIETVNRIPRAKSRTILQDDVENICQALLEFSLKPETWVHWYMWFGPKNLVNGLHRALGKTWDEVDPTIFDIIEEGFLLEAKELLTEALWQGAAKGVYWPRWAGIEDDEVVEFLGETVPDALSKRTTGAYP